MENKEVQIKKKRVRKKPKKEKYLTNLQDFKSIDWELIDFIK